MLRLIANRATAEGDEMLYRAASGAIDKAQSAASGGTPTKPPVLNEEAHGDF